MKAIHYAGMFILCNLYTTASFAATPQAIGWIEHVSVHPQQMIMQDKIDTVADNSHGYIVGSNNKHLAEPACGEVSVASSSYKQCVLKRAASCRSFASWATNNMLNTK